MLVAMSKRKYAVLAAVLAAALLAARPAGAQELTVTTSGSAGVILGVAREFVLSGSYVVSELDWPLLPAVFAGLAVNLATPVGFLASMEVQAAIPTPTGTMTDSDFLNGDGVKTHFSQSDGTLTGAVMLSLQAGWELPLPVDQPLSQLAPFLQFEYLRFTWTASNGYLQYPPETSYPYTPWSSSTTKVPIYGTGILYTQNYLIPSFGIKGTIQALDSLVVSFSMALSPYMWCFDVDEHLFRFLKFYDNLRGGIMLEPRLTATLKITPRMILSLDLLYRHIAGLTGDTLEVGTGATGYTPPPSGSDPGPGESISFPNSAGASLDAVNISILLSYKL
jgi:outer membrane protease